MIWRKELVEDIRKTSYSISYRRPQRCSSGHTQSLSIFRRCWMEGSSGHLSCPLNEIPIHFRNESARSDLRIYLSQAWDPNLFKLRLKICATESTCQLREKDDRLL